MSRSPATQRFARFRRKTLKVSAALLVAGLMSVALSAPANGNVTEGVDINLTVKNSSSTAVSAGYCPRGHVSIHYKFNTHHNPCSVYSFVHPMHANGGHWNDYKSNPFGVVVTAPNHHTFYFYLRNPSIGRPFIEANGNKLTMVEGQETHMALAGGTVAFHRRGDSNGNKQMIIDIIKMGPS